MINLSKVLENVVASRLHSSNASNHWQSASWKLHSNDTALVKIHNDILSSMDDGKVTALALFDLSAAFDTILLTILFF